MGGTRDGKGIARHKRKIDKFKGRHHEGRKAWSQAKRKAGFKRGAADTKFVRDRVKSG